MRPIKNSKEYAAVFLTGAAVYSLIEILWRGRTHWTMAVTGGICMLLIHRCNDRHSNLDLLGRCSLCSFYITGVEFAVGCLLNLRLNMMVWDYSDRYLNGLLVSPVNTGDYAEYYCSGGTQGNRRRGQFLTRGI